MVREEYSCSPVLQLTREAKALRGGGIMEDCTVTLNLVLGLGREMQSLSGTRSKPDELMRVLIAQRTYADSH